LRLYNKGMYPYGYMYPQVGNLWSKKTLTSITFSPENQDIALRTSGYPVVHNIHLMNYKLQ